MSLDDWIASKIADVREKRSTDLYLSHCDLLQIPPEVFQLKYLQHLDLRYNRLVYVPGEISKLKNLKGLYLNNNRLRELPDEISRLQNIQVLKLDNNRIKRLPEDLGGLKELRYLYSSGNQLKSLPASLFQLQQLKVLNLSNNRLETLPDEISRLNHLEVLDLTENHLVRLPPQISRLVALQLLYLNRNRLTELPLEMFQLTQLIRLDLNFNRLKELPDDISLLMSLRVLNVEGNQLERLTEELFHLENLGVLNADGNRIEELPQEIFNLHNLEYLSLSRNRLKKLPREISQLNNLVYSGIQNNPLELPPIEIAGRGIDAIRDYFNQIEQQGSDFLDEADLLLLGESGTGKTTLAKKLKDPDYQLNPAESVTVGIQIEPWYYMSREKIRFRLNIKDFGGNPIMQKVNRRFISKRALSLVVLDNRDNDHDFHYWYDLIRHLTIQGQPLFVVVNKKYPHPKQLPDSANSGLPPGIPVYAVNLEFNEGLEELLDAVREAAVNLPHVSKEPLPKKWLALLNALDTLPGPCLSLPQYLELCQRNGIDDEAQALGVSEFFHDLGILLHFQKDKILRNTIILDTRWAVEAVYKVLSNDMLHKNGGHADVPLLRSIWDGPAGREYQAQLLRLMMNLELCYTEDGNSTYTIPSLLPPQPPGVSQFNAIPDAQLLLFRYHYQFMPQGLLNRLMVKMFRFILGNMQWRSGVLLQIGDAQVEIIENLYHKELRLRIAGDGRGDALAMLRKEIKNLHDQIRHYTYDEMIPCTCSQCIGKAEPNFYPYKLLKEYRSQGRYKIICVKSLEDVVIHGVIASISIQANQPPPVHDRIIRISDDKKTKRRNKLFIAFARSDRQWLDRLHVHLKEFDDEGFEIEVWDDAQLSAGRKWEREIAEVFTEVKIVVLLISADFLSADFIVNDELAALMESAEKEGTVILPVVVKPSRLNRIPRLAHYQTVNHPTKPLIDLSEARQEDVFIRLIETIDENLRDINPTLTR